MSAVHLQQSSLGRNLDSGVVDILAKNFESYKVDKDLANCLTGVSLDRFKLPEDHQELFSVFCKIVTKNWHPLYLAVLGSDVSNPIAFDEFLEMCEVHAPLELQQARSKEVQQTLKFTTTLGSNITLPQRFLDYADVTSTIAYVVQIYSSGGQKLSRFSKDISYLWSMQSDLHMKRKRFAHVLASTLFDIDFNVPKVHLGMADFEFLAAVKVPDKQSLKPLIQAGLTQEMLDQIASLVLVRKGVFEPIAEYFDSVKFNRSSLQTNVDQTRGALNVVVTMNWHLLLRVMVYNNVSTYEQFLALCQEYAKTELEQAQSEEVQSRMCFVVTNSGLRKVGISDYRDLPLTIAYVLAQQDPANKIEGIDNENYLVLVKRALLVKRSQGATIVAEQILRLRVTKRNVSSGGTLVVAGSDDEELEPQHPAEHLLIGVEGEKATRPAGHKTPLADLFHKIKWPTKESLEPLISAGLTEELIHTISALPSYRDKIVEPIIEQIRELNVDRAALQANSRVRVAMKTLITLYWDPWHVFMCNNSVSRYDQFIAVCEEYAPEELENAKSAEVQSRLKFVVENGVRKPARSSYSDIALTIAYAMALHDSSLRENDAINRNYFKGIRNCLMSKRDQLALRMAKKLLNVDLKASGYGGGDADDGETPLKLTQGTEEYDSDDAPDASALVLLVNEAKDSSAKKGKRVSTRKRMVADEISEDDELERFTPYGSVGLDTSIKSGGRSRKKATPIPIEPAASPVVKAKRAVVKKAAAARKARASKTATLADDSDSDEKSIGSVA